MTKKIQWTDEQIEYLKENYLYKKFSEMESEIGLSESVMGRMAKALGLPPKTQKERIEHQFGMDICKLLYSLHWEKGMSVNQMEKHLGITRLWINTHMKECGIEWRGQSEAQKKVWADRAEDERKAQTFAADRLADEFKVSPATVKRDGKYAEAVDTLSDAIGDEARTTVLSGDSKVTKQDVADAAEWYKSTQQDTPILVANTEKEILEAANRIRYQKTEKRRSERKERNGKMCAEPPALSELPCRFDLVYADPPWRYEFNQTDSRVIENQYPTMALDDICNMPIGDITIENCVLFLWATFPKLEEAIQVVNAWGFKYRTAIVWDKVRMGQGIYTRQQTELLLIAIKGEMYKPESNYAGNFRSLVSIERSQNHSEKPKEFYNIIEGLYPDCTKIELFARNQRDGWAAWGNQA